MRDRDLVRLYWPVELRAAFDALFAIDDGFGGIVMTSTQPMLGAIRLTWWREALERLDHLAPPPEPRLQAVARELLPLGVRGGEVAKIADGWTALLEETPIIAAVAERGAALFSVGAALLGEDDPNLAAAGGLYATVDAARRGLELMTEPSGLHTLSGHRFSRRLRPLTALARLAARDFRRKRLEPEASPGRAAALFAHRWSGKVV